MTRKRHRITLNNNQTRLLELVTRTENAAKQAIIEACKAGIPCIDIVDRCGRSHARIFEIAKVAGVRLSDTIQAAGKFRSGVKATLEQRQEIVRLIRSGLSQRQTAKQIGCSVWLVNRVWKHESERWGIKA